MDNQNINNNPANNNNHPSYDAQIPTPINSKQKSPIIIATILFCVLIFFFILIIIKNTQPKTDNYKNSNDISTENTSVKPTGKNATPIETINYKPIEKTSKKPMSNLTKEEAIEAYKESYSFGYLPSDSLPSALKATDCMPTYNLLNSYETKDDINLSIASNVEKIESVGDYYVVITQKTTSEHTKHPMCIKNIMFNNMYFSYGLKYGYDESGNGPYRKFVDYSSDTINTILPVLALTTEGHPTLYDYDIREDDSYITVNMYSIGVRDKTSNNSSASIIFKTQYYRFDKTTKEVGLLRGDESLVLGTTKIDSKVIPISDDEFKELKEYIY